MFVWALCRVVIIVAEVTPGLIPTLLAKVVKSEILKALQNRSHIRERSTLHTMQMDEINEIFNVWRPKRRR